LTDINERLNSSNETIKTLEIRLQGAIKICMTLAVLIALRLLAMVVAYVIYLKGIPLPRWLDILL
jgi:hypothetical protein